MKSFLVCLSVAILFGLSGTSYANLVLNGSFETQSGYVGGSDGFDDVTSIAGWRLVGGFSGDPGLGYTGPILGVAPGINSNFVTGQDGTNWAYNIRGIFQTLDSARFAVVAGQDYNLSFLAARDTQPVTPAAAVSIEWYTDQTGYSPSLTPTTFASLVTNNVAQGFQTFSLIGTAPVGATYAGVKFDTTLAALPGNVGGVVPVGAGIRLDGVSVTAVPEPSSIALVGCGIAGALRVARRRRK